MRDTEFTTLQNCNKKNYSA